MVRLVTIRRLRVLVLASSIALIGLVFRPPHTSAHIPITTKITFNREVVRILQRNCAGCHRTGGIAFSLAVYDEARPWAKDLEYEVLRRQMPCWQVVKGYGDFSNAPGMTIRDTEVLVNWVENGVPEGEPKDLPKATLSDSFRLGTPDLVLKPAAGIAVPAGKDEYKDIVLPANLKTDRWVRAVDLKPGDGAVVHCAAIYAEEGGDPQGPGSRAPGQLLGYWMPGQKAISWPSGAGQLLKAGSRLIVRVHYHGAESDKTDLSEIGLYFSRQRPAREVTEAEIDSPQLDLPVSAAPQRVVANYTLTDDSELLALRPAANPLVVSFQATAYRPDGSVKVLTWTTRGKWDWSPIYQERKPVVLPKGTRIETTLYFDNSNSNKYNPNSPAEPVRWGAISSEPFCTLMLAAKSAD